MCRGESRRGGSIMAQDKQNPGSSPPAGTKACSTPGASSAGTSSGGPAPTPNQILQSSWSDSIDSQTAQQFNGLAQIRQARASQLERRVASLTATYGASDPRV